ncbi:MAG: NADH-quinone oxidoreductase subunit N [Candidatus Omnitrophica bacterium]|nr:NADH-quinone oxidoreductase subunit N [Candidatus Omnitrophota bacterium]
MNLSSLNAVAVELVVGAWAVLLLSADLLQREARKHSLWAISGLGVLCAGAVLWWQQAWVGQHFGPMFVFDAFAAFFKGLFLLTALIVVLMTRVFTRLLPGNIGEFHLLIFSALLGMLVLASVTDLLLLFIGLELLTFSLYVMAAYLKTDKRSVEAGLKYLVLGSISSGFLVYGISLLYGAAGGTNFALVSRTFASGAVPPLAVAGMLLVMAGLGFKIAAVPFHLWVPDVYEGAPTPVVALLSVGSKMAGIVVLLRVLYGVFLPAQAVWGGVLAVLSAATMCYGNLAAIPQTNIKRLLGYSSIGHAGYLLMGLATATASGAQAVGFYLLAYLFSNLAVFFVVVLVGSLAGGDSLESYNGLSRRSPLLAATLFIGLLSLAGVPPLAGFSGKLLVLLAAVEGGRLWLAAIGAVNVAISLYYYLLIVRRMYLLPAASAPPIAADRLTRLVLFLLMAAIVGIGVFQEPFLQLIPSSRL